MPYYGLNSIVQEPNLGSKASQEPTQPQGQPKRTILHELAQCLGSMPSLEPTESAEPMQHQETIQEPARPQYPPQRHGIIFTTGNINKCFPILFLQFYSN